MKGTTDGTAGIGRQAVRACLLVLAVACACPVAAQGPQPDPAAADPVARGAYILHAAGCASCHTARGEGAAPLAGGTALTTAFGTFYSPNITPDPEHGIGRWTEEEFARALRQGISPEGYAYYPAFPYTSYTGMTDRDVADLWAYLRTVPPAAQENRPHELGLPYRWRFLLPVWRWLYFEEGATLVDAGRPPSWNRGAYLVGNLAHCGECHTPRGLLGGPDHDRLLAGNPEAPEGRGSVPNITPDPEDGIGDWSDDDLIFFLELGMLPDGDFAGGSMARVIEETTSRLTPEDRAAIVEFLRSVPAVGGIRG